MLNYPKLESEHIILEPLRFEHKTGLQEIVQDGDLWELWFITPVPKPDELEEFIEVALQTRLAYMIYSKSRECYVGTTSIYNFEEKHKKAYIGYTFYRSSAQKTSINTETKQLLLQYLFEDLKLNVVRLETHYLNLNSRRAIARLGAKQEGILRNDKIMPDGSIRDTVIFSIVREEWPGVKNHLNYCLHKKYIK
ncbi:GNAT family N-acetyltransferase [Neisseriaceae bacterium PsAf]|nr:GNAT family N-acetyltransferase [Neisseriaceae bacterium PsAf]